MSERKVTDLPALSGFLAAQKLICERSLYDFVQYLWHVVEPAAEFVPGDAIEVICEHLEAVEEGDIRRLIVNVPPGFSKSLVTGVFFPAWCWGPRNRPSMRFLTAAYSVYLTERDNERCARLVMSPEYQMLWGSRVTLTKTGVTKIATNKTGWKFATSVGGTTTGERGDCLVGSTVVETDAGPKTIEEIATSNDKCYVLSYDEKTKCTQFQRVRASVRRGHRPLWRIRTQSGRVVECTGNHRFYTKDGWKEAASLSVGEVLVRAVQASPPCGGAFKAEEDIVSLVEPLRDQQEVYDIEVANTRCFFANGILVHNCIIIDDANNPKEAESKAVRDSTNLYLTEVIPTRLNNPRKSSIINIQQRTHEEDATGTLMGAWEDYTHLMLPMRYDPDRHCETSLGFSDWRTHEGELLWPERFPEHVVRELERMGPYATASQLQQAPVPRGGGLIQREWWQEWAPKESPPVEFVLASLDTAIKDKEESDYYALTVWAVWKDPDTGTPKLLLLNAWRDRAPLHEIVERVVQTCRKLRVDRLLIEDKAHGWVAQKEIMRAAGGWKFGISMFDPRRYGDKTARLLSVQHLFAEGLIYAPVTTDAAGNTNWREWAQMVIDEISSFPRAKHDDLCDSASQALRYLRDIGFALNKAEHAREENDLAMHRKKSAPLYPV